MKMNEPHVYSPKYPPKNRVDTRLHILELEFEDKLGKFKCDLNRAAVIGMTRKLPLALAASQSFLSGEPAFWYRNSDGVEVALSEGEILRLLRHDLRPAEVLKLHRHFGAFHETHDDFYEEESGGALQPMEA